MARLHASLHCLTASAPPTLATVPMWIGSGATRAGATRCTPGSAGMGHRVRFRGSAFTTSRCYGEAYTSAFTAAFHAIHELEAVNLLITIRHLVPSNSEGSWSWRILTTLPPPPPSTRAVGRTPCLAPGVGRSGSSPPSVATRSRYSTSPEPGCRLLQSRSCLPLGPRFVRRTCASMGVRRIRVDHPVTPLSSIDKVHRRGASTHHCPSVRCPRPRHPVRRSYARGGARPPRPHHL